METSGRMLAATHDALHAIHCVTPASRRLLLQYRADSWPRYRSESLSFLHFKGLGSKVRNKGLQKGVAKTSHFGQTRFKPSTLHRVRQVFATKARDKVCNRRGAWMQRHRGVWTHSHVHQLSASAVSVPRALACWKDSWGSK